MYIVYTIHIILPSFIIAPSRAISYLFNLATWSYLQYCAFKIGGINKQLDASD